MDRLGSTRSGRSGDHEANKQTNQSNVLTTSRSLSIGAHLQCLRPITQMNETTLYSRPVYQTRAGNALLDLFRDVRQQTFAAH